MFEPENARFDHVGISVADYDGQLRWYREVLGLAEIVIEVAMPEVDVRAVILESPSGMRLELLERRGSRPGRGKEDPVEALDTHGVVHFALRVDDVDAVVNRLQAAGADVAWPPGDGPGGSRVAFLRDPEGNTIELLSEIT